MSTLVVLSVHEKVGGLRACSDARFSREKRFSEKRFRTAFPALDITLPDIVVGCYSSHQLRITASLHITHL